VYFELTASCPPACVEGKSRRRVKGPSEGIWLSGSIWRHLGPSGSIWRHLKPSGWFLRPLLSQILVSGTPDSQILTKKSLKHDWSTNPVKIYLVTAPSTWGPARAQALKLKPQGTWETPTPITNYLIHRFHHSDQKAQPRGGLKANFSEAEVPDRWCNEDFRFLLFSRVRWMTPQVQK